MSEIKIEPIKRHEKAFNNLLENGGNYGNALKDAGYSDSISKRPKHVTNTKGWKELMDEHLSDNKLAQVHAEGLEAEDNNGKADLTIRHKYLDTAYKLKGSYAGDKNAGNVVQVNVNVDNAQKDLADEYEEKLRKTIINEPTTDINTSVDTAE